MKKYLLIILAIIIPTLTVNPIVNSQNINAINNKINEYNLSLDNSNQYQNSFNTMFTNMISNNDLLFSNPKDINDNKEVFKVANRANSNKYLIVRETYQNKIIDLIIETQYWYLDGFVPIIEDASQYTYYHFTKAKILTLPWVKHNVDLKYNGDYYSLAGKDKDVDINKDEIVSSFNELYNASIAKDLKLLKLSLVTTVFETAEALRFFTVRNSVSQVLNNGGSFSWRKNYLDNTLRKWGEISREYYSGSVTNAKAKISTLNLPRR